MTRHFETYLTSTEQLCAFCSLPVGEAPYELDSAPEYRCQVPRSYAEKIRKGDWFDPLLLQVLPRTEENASSPAHYSCDPVGDAGACIQRGLLHKYHGRILLLTTSSCAIHCRFCFRRGQNVRELLSDGSGDDAVAAYILNTPSISEVILSGGDPFTLPTQRFEKLVDLILSLRQLTTIRLHTRTAVAAPETVSEHHLNLIRSIAEKKRCIVVTHCNHPQEIGADNRDLTGKLRSTGVLLFNQAVLLKHINDSVAVQQKLADELLSLGIVPYYLHQLDRVTGAHHFEVPAKQGIALIDTLRSVQPGYAVPRYVREVAGEDSKQMVL